MSLARNIRVKISSESAELISISPVVVQDMRLDELIGLLLRSVGKDLPRFKEILHRGIFVSGASKLRWEGFEAAESDLIDLVSRFPDSDGSRVFDPKACIWVALVGPKSKVVLERENAQRRRFLRRRSLWSEVMLLLHTPAYAEYSYKEQADMYRAYLDPPARERLRQAARLSPYSSVVRQIENSALDWIDAYVRR